MTTQTVDLIITEPLTEGQEAAFEMFREKIERHLPGSRLRAVSPYNNDIIQVWIEIENETYQRGLKACKLAVEVQDETGICIILR